MRLVWTKAALDDRRAIYDFIEADNPSAALKLDELFSEKASRLLWLFQRLGVLVESLAPENW